MKFELVDRQGYIPDLNYGDAGQELSCFIPADYPFQQVSYNNGEGEAIIDKHTWQFFFTQEGIGMQLIDGIVTLKEAEHFLHDVKSHIWGEANQEVQIFIAGATPK
ncbi:hypothetical protein C0J08_16395 [Marinomonas sp. CT5]|uniref:hypothetical protein n=1 Tax=Marinomonas sp. CT5 TaxID=2066133 RepID=UPI001812FD13|nr:hypothetical protein [Marinomonas sp. CT5]NVK72693.1 hypothetical protein [Oceanospirillaceae bacterium]QUX96881.1 hypothetical protein C0J08_16395 [Marinomonas sp. CT5]